MTTNGVEDLQGNANPASFPELSDDGQVLVYISDSYDPVSKPNPSIYDSAAHYSVFDGSSYPESTAIPGPADFAGCGDSDADVAGTGSFAAAAWVRMNTNLPGKDAKDEVTAAEQNLLINGTEIVVSIYDGGELDLRAPDRQRHPRSLSRGGHGRQRQGCGILAQRLQRRPG